MSSPTPEQIENLMRLCEKCATNDFLATRYDLGAEYAFIRELCEKAQALQRFKDWVHGYLDSKGVPFHPPGTHGAEGCRIGDRMDFVFNELGKLRAVAEAAKKAVENADDVQDSDEMGLPCTPYCALAVEDVESIEQALAALDKSEGGGEA